MSFLYATAAKGFKSGGFVGQAVEPVAAATLFNPEYVWNYEVGVKSELFDQRMRLNAAAFQMDPYRYAVHELPRDRSLRRPYRQAVCRSSKARRLDWRLGELQVRADVAYTGERYLNLQNTVSDGSITRLDMRVSYDLGSYTFALWGKNLRATLGYRF